MRREHVDERFPAHAERITLLLGSNPAFREICRDYEEICTWMATHCIPGRESSQDCIEARRAAQDLETEIVVMLEDSSVTG